MCFLILHAIHFSRFCLSHYSSTICGRSSNYLFRIPDYFKPCHNTLLHALQSNYMAINSFDQTILTYKNFESGRQKHLIFVKSILFPAIIVSIWLYEHKNLRGRKTKTLIFFIKSILFPTIPSFIASCFAWNETDILENALVLSLDT